MKKQITLLFALLFSFAANLLAQKEARQQLNFVSIGHFRLRIVNGI